MINLVHDAALFIKKTRFRSRRIWATGTDYYTLHYSCMDDVRICRENAKNGSISWIEQLHYFARQLDSLSLSLVDTVAQSESFAWPVHIARENKRIKPTKPALPTRNPKVSYQSQKCCTW